jgi:hypothetical protein
LVTRVRRITSIDGDYAVAVDFSSTEYVFRVHTAEDARRLGRLEESRAGRKPIAIVLDDESEAIVDVPISHLDFDLGIIEGPKRRSADDVIKDLRPITVEQAQDLFCRLRAGQCTLPLPPPGEPTDCLPIQYPDNGCFAIASRACELIQNSGIDVCKAWLFAAEGRRLRFPTANRFRCTQAWNSHVVPAVRVGSPNDRDLLVLDLASMTARGPVTPEEWRRSLGDPNAQLDFTDVTVFQQSEPNDPEPLHVTPKAVEDWLGHMRDGLRKRSKTQSSPPPYRRCGDPGKEFCQ